MLPVRKMMSSQLLASPVCVILGCVITICAQASADVSFTKPLRQFDPTNYCNFKSYINKAEGQNMKGYTLKLIDLIMTPGEVNIPLDVKVQGQTANKFTSCDLKFSPTFSEKINTFTEVSDVYRVVQEERHGFKKLHPAFSQACASHHVTSFGLRQMVSLGEHLNAAYFHPGSDSKLVPKASSIHVESLATHSTYQSLLSFLHGLLPEKQFTKIKVRKSLENFCSLSTMERETCTCHHTQDLNMFITRALNKGRYMFKDSIYGADVINDIMSKCIEGPVGGIELFEYLMLYRCNNMTSPCIDGTSCLCSTQQQLEQLHAITSTYLRHLYNDPTFRTFSQMKTYPLLSRLVHRSLKNMGDRMNIYMGTRPFLQFLITGLGLQQQEVMPLGSRFTFESYQKNWGQADSGDLYLRFLLNGEDVTGSVIGCKDLENGLCPLKSFNTTVLSMSKEYLDLC